MQMGEVEPEMDTSDLTQVDQAMAHLHGQQVQAMKCTFDQLDIRQATQQSMHCIIQATTDYQ